MNDGLSMYSLAAHFALLSLMAVGGGVIMLAPEMHTYVVDLHRLMTSEQFAAAYTLAQAAPGPNLLYVTLVGYQIAGWTGALVTTAAMIVPPSLMTLAFIKVSAKHGDSRIGRAFQAGIAPLSVGMLFAGAWVLGKASNLSWQGIALALVACALSARTKINPVLLIGAGALFGVLGLI
jgi:chromate transporter